MTSVFTRRLDIEVNYFPLITDAKSVAFFTGRVDIEEKLHLSLIPDDQ